jgi:phage shock protein C
MGKLAKSSYDKKLFGVCGGLAKRFGMDSTVIRVIFVVAAVIGLGSPILLYILLAIIMPSDY